MENPLTASDLPPKWKDWYEERAAILEFMGNMSRQQAEAKALWLVQAAMRRAEPQQGALL